MSTPPGSNTSLTHGASLEYLGGSGARLLTTYHEPTTATVRDTAVLLCQPVAHEYVRCHRAMRQLAVNLASVGFPVMRFDWTGIGDSAGEFSDATLGTWVQDAARCARALRKAAGSSRLAVVGLRLGATVSLLASKKIKPDAQFLWEPIVQGADYLQDATTQCDVHEEHFGRPDNEPKSGLYADGRRELLGDVASAELVQELESLDLAAAAEPTKRGTTVVLVNSQHDDATGFAETIGATHAHIPDGHIWSAEPHQGVVPASTIRALVSGMITLDDRLGV